MMTFLFFSASAISFFGCNDGGEGEDVENVGEEREEEKYCIQSEMTEGFE
jgi:hypothetical protein